MNQIWNIIIGFIDDPKTFSSTSLVSKQLYEICKSQVPQKMDQFTRVTKGEYVRKGKLPNGNLHGEYELLYDPVKRKWIQCTYINGKLEGEYKYWDYGGQLLEDHQYKNGEKHGASKRYYHNKAMKEMGFYVNGKRHGKYYYWNDRCELIAKIVYVHGVSQE